MPDSPFLLAGTHIIYDRKFLLECKNLAGARTLPCCPPQIPGVTSLAQSSLVKLEEHKEQNESEEAMPGEQPRWVVQPLPKGDQANSAWGMGLLPGHRGKGGRLQLSLGLFQPLVCMFPCMLEEPHPNPCLYPSIPLQIKTSVTWTSEFPASCLQAVAGPVPGPCGGAGTVTSWLQPSLMLGMNV